MADRNIPLGVSVITILMFIGAIFDIAGGVFMIALAVYLEKQRRRLIGQINSASTQPSN